MACLSDCRVLIASHYLIIMSIQDKLAELHRQRVKKMANLLPELVANKKAPSFFYYSKEHYVDYEKLTQKAFVYQPLPREDPVAKYRRVVTSQHRKSLALGMMGQQLKLSVDDIVTSPHDETEQGNPIKFQPYSLQRTALYDKGCITCGGPNISVTYHGERHICLKCREKITTLNGDPVVIFKDDDEEVVVVAMSDQEGGKKMYFVQLDELRINGYRCYVTFSGENELICLLHDKYNDMHPTKYLPKSAIYQANQVNKKQVKQKNYIKINKNLKKGVVPTCVG